MVDSPDLLMVKLIERLHAVDSTTRRNAAGALRLHGPRAACAVPHLSHLLSDEDADVRNEARRALDRLTRSVA